MACLKTSLSRSIALLVSVTLADQRLREGMGELRWVNDPRPKPAQPCSYFDAVFTGLAAASSAFLAAMAWVTM